MLVYFYSIIILDFGHSSVSFDPDFGNFLKWVRDVPNVDGKEQILRDIITLTLSRLGAYYKNFWCFGQHFNREERFIIQSQNISALVRGSLELNILSFNYCCMYNIT